MKKLLTTTLALGLITGLTACANPPTQNQKVNNCASLPEQLAGKTWQVEDLNHQGIIDNSNLTITFEDGKIYGSATCNRYSAGYELNNCAIKFTHGLSTKMACPEALMNQEDKFLSSLDKLNSIKIDQTGALIIEGSEQTYIKAYPTKQE